MFEYKSMAIQYQGENQPNKGLKKLFYSEGKTVAVDTESLDKLINEQAAEGWELATHSTLPCTEHITFIVTFRKAK